MKIAGVVERKAVFSREPGMEGCFAGLGNISVICPLLLASLAFSAFPFRPHVLFRRPRGEIIYTARGEFREILEPGSKCWGCGGPHCKIGRDGRCRFGSFRYFDDEYGVGRIAVLGICFQP